MEMKELEIYDDEISLIDLVKVLIKRKKYLTVVFFITLTASIVFALISQVKVWIHSSCLNCHYY